MIALSQLIISYDHYHFRHQVVTDYNQPVKLSEKMGVSKNSGTPKTP